MEVITHIVYLMVILTCTTEAYHRTLFPKFGLGHKALTEVRQLPNLHMSGDIEVETVFNDILEQQFLELSMGNGKKLDWKKFFEWEEVRALLAERVCDAATIEGIWCKVAGSLQNEIDYKQFSTLSGHLDSFFEIMEDGEEMGFDAAVVDSIEAIADADIWSQDFNPTTAIEPEFLTYLTNFFTENTSGKGKSKLSFADFAGWGDVQSMLGEGELDDSCLKELWAEAVVKQKSLAGGDMKLTKELTLDSFVRLNIRLDQTLDEIAEALDALTDDDVINYYREVFEKITGSLEGTMSQEQLLAWAKEEELQVIASPGQIESLWDALPKKGGGGIDVASFLAFNEAVEDIEEIE